MFPLFQKNHFGDIGDVIVQMVPKNFYAQGFHYYGVSLVNCYFYIHLSVSIPKIQGMSYGGTVITMFPKNLFYPLYIVLKELLVEFRALFPRSSRRKMGNHGVFYLLSFYILKPLYLDPGDKNRFVFLYFFGVKHQSRGKSC